MSYNTMDFKLLMILLISTLNVLSVFTREINQAKYADSHCWWVSEQGFLKYFDGPVIGSTRGIRPYNY